MSPNEWLIEKFDLTVDIGLFMTKVILKSSVYSF